MTRRHEPDVTGDHAHDSDVDSTSLQTFTDAQQRVATVLGLGRRLCEREYRAVVELAGMTECRRCSSPLSGTESDEPYRGDVLTWGERDGGSVTDERRSA